MIFMKKVKKHPFVRYCLMSNGVLTKTTATVFPRGPKKKKSSNDDKHGHGQEKRRPRRLLALKPLVLADKSGLIPGRWKSPNRAKKH